MSNLMALLRGKLAIRTGIAIAVVLLLWIGASLAIPLFVSSETIRSELVSRIEQATGRQARIDGKISISTFPRINLSAGGIGLSTSSGEDETLSVESISVGVRPWALLSGRIVITRVVLDRPRILIEATGNEEPVSAGPAAEEATAEDVGQSLAVLDRLRLGTIHVRDGSLVWRRTDGAEEVFEAIDLTVDVPTLAEGGTIDGRFAWRGLDPNVSLKIGAPGDVDAMRRVPLELALKSDALELSGGGMLFDTDTVFAGEINAEGDSVRAVAAAFDTTLPDLPGYGPYRLAARIAVNPGLVRLVEFGVALKGLVARGGAVVDLNRPRPGVGLKLVADEVDFNQFTASDPASTANAASGDGSGATAGLASDQPLDLSFLHLADSNIDISAARLSFGPLTATDLAADATVVNGVLNANLRSVGFGGSPGSGSLTVDASGPVAAISGTLNAAGMDLATMASLAGSGQQLSGTGRLDVSFDTSGQSMAGLIDKLEARGELAVAGGRYAGLNLAETFNDLSADVVEDIDVTARFSALDQPVAAEGRLTWRGEPFNVAAVASPKAMLAGESSDVQISVSSARGRFGYAGALDSLGRGGGEITVETNSLRDLLAWVGRPVAVSSGLGAFAVTGTISANDDTVAFDARDIRLDGSSGRGSGSVRFAGSRPAVEAELALATLDLTPYLGGGSAGGGAGGGAAGAAAGGAGAGWSPTPVGFDGLSAIDANLSLTADRIVLDDIATNRSSLTATIAKGQLNAELTELSLYNGSGSGRLQINGAASVPSVEANFSLANLAALPFLSDAIGLQRLEGVGALEIAVSAAGISQLDLVSNLDGSASFEFRDGAIRGIDIAKLMRGLTDSILTGWQISEQDSTRFTRLAGSFQIDNGIATTEDLSLAGPLVRVSGAGTIDLPRKSLALRVDPRLVASLEGQGGSTDVAGFSVPVVIEGPWARPRIYPDIEGILENPQAALQQLQQLGDGIIGLTGDDAGGGLISRILGGDGNAGGDGASDGVSGLIGNLFGRGNNAPPPQASEPPAAPADAGIAATGQEPETVPPPDDPIGAALEQGLGETLDSEVAPPAPPAEDVAALSGADPAIDEQPADNDAATTPVEGSEPKPKKVPFIRLRATPDGQLVATPGQDAPAGFPVAEGSQIATGMTAGPQMPILEDGEAGATGAAVVPPLPRPKPDRETAAVDPNAIPPAEATPDPNAVPQTEAGAETPAEETPPESADDVAATAEAPAEDPAAAEEPAPEGTLLLPETTDDVLRDLFGQ